MNSIPNINRTSRTGRSLAAMGLILFGCMGLIGGCRREAPPPGDFLVRISDEGITVGDYNEAMEMAQAAYPRETLKNGMAIREIKWRVLNELIEELLLRLKAKELNIEVSESELRREIDTIRSDYPGDLFEKSFMENAISYNAWTKRLSARMLMQKVIDQVIFKEISVSDEEIMLYYREHFPDKDSKKPPADDVRDFISQRIRQDKAETAYREWLRNVYGEYDQKYGIERNMDGWLKQLES